MPRAKAAAKSTARSTARRPRKTSAPRRSRNARPHRLGPLFFTVVAVTGLCALAFMGLVAGAMAGAG